VWQVGLGDMCCEDASKDAVLQCILFQNDLNLPELGGRNLVWFKSQTHHLLVGWLVGWLVGLRVWIVETCTFLLLLTFLSLSSFLLKYCDYFC